MNLIWDLILIGVIGLLIATPAQATGGGTAPTPTPSTSSASANASASSGSTATGGSLGEVNIAGSGGANVKTESYALGAPSVGNGGLTCEMVIPVIGGSAPWEREACAVVRDARALYDLIPAAQERDAAVKALLCTTPRIHAAFALTGRPCKEAP